MAKILIFALLTIGVAYYFSPLFTGKSEITKLPETNWGPLNTPKDFSIRPFKIDVPKNVIDDLNDRLSRSRELVQPLENVGWSYGISSKSVKDIVHYWRNQYDWFKRQTLLNRYPQFITKIQGLDIHFYHVKPQRSEINGKKLKVLPLLLTHGWPGSIVEFQKMIPLLTTPKEGKDFVFEIVAPSLPGYGFSQSAVKPGLGPAQCAVIFKNLMTRLGFDKFYTQGGDWGSLINSHIAGQFPERVLGHHLNMCTSGLSLKSMFWLIVGSYFPSLVVEPEHYSKVYPLKHHWSRLLEESGYFHLQATKPDTIGGALMQSPTALALYILEKFSTWTNPEYRFREDGGLLEKFTLDELLDNIMVYWVTNSISTSARLYAEYFNAENMGRLESYHFTPLTGCAIFPHELTYTPKSINQMTFKNLIHYNYMPRGGHFAAFEEPELLAQDFWAFVETIQNFNNTS